MNTNGQPTFRPNLLPPFPKDATPPEVMRHLEELVGNVMMARSDLFKQLFDPRRDIDDECGYPRSEPGSGFGSINPEFYRALYERECLATRTVQVLPKESWQVSPTVYEDESPDNITEFEEAWDGLAQTLRGEACWYQDEIGSPIWEHLQRADILSGIGHFGILLIGIDDGLNLDQPAEGVSSLIPPNMQDQGKDDNDTSKTQVGGAFGGTALGTFGPYAAPGSQSGNGSDKTRDTQSSPNGTSLSGATGTDAQYVGIQLSPPEFPSGKPNKDKRKLLFLRAFDESLVQIVQYEADVRNPRFGQPVMYRVTLNDPREMHSGIGLPMATVRIHWSRVIHLADNLGSSEIFGVPRMRPVLNRLLDLRKLYSGSAEMYWRGAFPGISLETVPQLGGDVEVDQKALSEMMENYMNGLQRYLSLMGMSAKTLSPQVVDPTPQIASQVEAICIQLGIPVRVFKGSERGELASSQDDDAWLDRLRHRQSQYITPRIIVPFVDRLISMGILPEPKGYSVEWPDLESLGDSAKATICLQKTQAIAAYVSGNVETVLPPIDYLTHFLGMDEEEAQAILDDAKEAQETMTMPPPGELGHPSTPDQPPPPPIIAGMGKGGKPQAGQPSAIGKAGPTSVSDAKSGPTNPQPPQQPKKGGSFLPKSS